MALLWADIPSGDTGIYGTTTSYMLSGVWAELGGGTVSLDEDPDPTITGNVLTFGDGITAGYARFVNPGGAQNTAGIATRLWMNSLPNTDARRPWIHQFRDVSNNLRLGIRVSTTGTIQVYRDVAFLTDIGTLIGETTGPVLTAQAWRHVETKVLWSTTVGTVTIKVEGVEVLALTGVNTGAGNYAQFCIGVSATSVTTVNFAGSMKDVVFWDGTGSQNNDFLGPVGVYWRQPNADISSGWARTSGSTDYGLVDESPPVDAGYIYADDTPPAASIMGMEALPADVVAIRGIISVARAQKSDGGDGNMQVSLSPNGTDWDTGADNAISTAFTYYLDVSEVSPDTAAPWTPVEVDSLEIRLNRTL